MGDGVYGQPIDSAAHSGPALKDLGMGPDRLTGSGQRLAAAHWTVVVPVTTLTPHPVVVVVAATVPISALLPPGGPVRAPRLLLPLRGRPLGQCRDP